MDNNKFNQNIEMIRDMITVNDRLSKKLLQEDALNDLDKFSRGGADIIIDVIMSEDNPFKVSRLLKTIYYLINFTVDMIAYDEEADEQCECDDCNCCECEEEYDNDGDECECKFIKLDLDSFSEENKHSVMSAVENLLAVLKEQEKVADVKKSKPKFNAARIDEIPLPPEMREFFDTLL